MTPLIVPPVRGIDKWGSGAYQASRLKRGKRVKHKGIDLAALKGSGVLAMTAGVVTKIGYPYHPRNKAKGHLRYVEVTDKRDLKARYFYIDPVVVKGQEIKPYQLIGLTQGLTHIYPGITDHYHFEVLRQSGRVMNPHHYIEKFSDLAIGRDYA